MVFDFDSIDTSQGLVLAVVERDPPILEKRLMRPAGSPALDWPPADWDPRFQFPPSAWSYVSDSDPRDPIEREFAQDPEEAWKWVQNRVQLCMAKRITPMFVWLTWEPPRGIKKLGHLGSWVPDRDVREFTFGQMAVKYDYQLHYHGREISPGAFHGLDQPTEVELEEIGRLASGLPPKGDDLDNEKELHHGGL